jgi:hypothetical protein
MASSPASSSGRVVQDKPVSNSAKTRRNGLLITIAIVVAVILALALGLGLGLGLMRHHQGGTSSLNSSAEDSQASSNVQPWRRNTEDYLLDFQNWDLNAAPTTRSYNFTVSEIAAAPDGMVPDIH